MFRVVIAIGLRYALAVALTHFAACSRSENPAKQSQPEKRDAASNHAPKLKVSSQSKEMFAASIRALKKSSCFDAKDNAWKPLERALDEGTGRHNPLDSDDELAKLQQTLDQLNWVADHDNESSKMALQEWRSAMKDLVDSLAQWRRMDLGSDAATIKSLRARIENSLGNVANAASRLPTQC